MTVGIVGAGVVRDAAMRGLHADYIFVGILVIIGLFAVFTGRAFQLGIDGLRQADQHVTAVLGGAEHRRVPVEDGDTVETLAARILEREHAIYPQALALLAAGQLEIDGRRVETWPSSGAALSRAVPIYATTSYVFHNTEHAANLFGPPPPSGMAAAWTGVGSV